MSFVLYWGAVNTPAMYLFQQNKEYQSALVDAPRERETVWLDTSEMCAVPHSAAEKEAQLHSLPWFPIVDMLQRDALIPNDWRCYTHHFAMYGAVFNIMTCAAIRTHYVTDFLSGQQAVRYFSTVDCTHCGLCSCVCWVYCVNQREGTLRLALITITWIYFNLEKEHFEGFESSHCLIGCLYVTL